MVVCEWIAFNPVATRCMTMTDFSRLRQLAGLSISEAAEVAGYTVRTIRRWEKGETRPRQSAICELLAYSRAVGAPEFTFIDLFAGIGGMRRGFEAIGGECVFTSEYNKYAVETYRKNYSCNHEIAGDITEIEAADIPPHDVLLAGFPCQPFSIAGVSKKNALNMPHGFRCETQGTLFFDIKRILEYHRPVAFLLENVKNLVNHDKGRTFRIIRETLEERLGYQISPKVIDARSWLPQHRERIFIVGFRKPNGFTFDNLEIPDPVQGPKLRTILHPENGTEPVEKRFTSGKLGKVNDKYTLSDKLWRYLQAYAEKHRRKGNGFGFGLVGPDDISRTLSARYYKDGSEILLEQADRNPRRLTPRECARLMGFDKQGEEPFIIPVSDVQAYKQFGNAVAVPVVETVAKHMRPWLPTLHDDDCSSLAAAKELQAIG